MEMEVWPMTRSFVGAFACALLFLPTACAPGATGVADAGPIVYLAEAPDVFVTVSDAIEAAPKPYASEGWRVSRFLGPEGFIRADAASETFSTACVGDQPENVRSICFHTVIINVKALDGGRVSVTIETSQSPEARGLAARIRLALASAFTVE
jgi:hypothetical protein